MSSNISIFNPTQAPAFARSAAPSALAAALSGGDGTFIQRISVKGGVFRLIAGGKEVAAIDDRHLDVVIVNASPSVGRTFYEAAFDENVAAAPSCWSADGTTPDASAPNPQSDSCARCPQNIQGSGQGDSRACRYSQLLAVKLASEVESGEVKQLSVAATSLFGKATGADDMPLQAYARHLAAQNIGPEMVVTRMRFDTKAATPKLFFKPMRWLTDAEYQAASAAGQSPEAQQAITPSFSKATPSAAPVIEGTRPALSAPKVAAAPVEAEKATPVPVEAPKAVRGRPAKTPKEYPTSDVAQEPVQEPVVRAAPAKPLVAPTHSASVADLVAGWDADD